MEQYHVTGMTCAACSARVEKAVSAVPGVTSCAVSLLTNSMGVEGDVSPSAIIEAVTAAGYGASAANAEASASVESQEESLKDHESPLLLKRLIVSLVFLLVLMYFSMGVTMWHWPVPAFFEHNPIAIGLVQMLLAGIVMVINQRFFIRGFQSLWRRSPNMDALVALGSAASFLYSTYQLFAMTVVSAEEAHAHMHDLYFEGAAMILTLITVGKMLEARSKGKTTDALRSLMQLAPKTATLMQDGKEVVVPIAKVKKGDRFVVRPGESIPVDGVLVDGIGAVNESALTGESIPVDKAPGDLVSAATINQSGYLVCEATRVGEDTTLSQIIRMVSDAAATKAPIAKIADKVAGIFVPTVISLAVLTTIIWLIVGAIMGENIEPIIGAAQMTFGFALARGISVLVISCPCALGLATPVAIMVANGVGAKNGILFKTASALEITGHAKTVILDKTGTITKGEPVVTDICAADGVAEDMLLQLAYALESKSEHPLAHAVVTYAEEKNLSASEISDFEALPGNGLRGTYQGTRLIGGKRKFIEETCKIPDTLLKQAEALASDGKTPLFFAQDAMCLGMIAVADVIKEDSAQAIRELRDMGVHVVMLTGDNAATAAAIGKQAGVDEIIAGVLPDGKEAVVRKFQKQGRTIMVGDGINDAPALTAADIGIAIGAGADVAVDAADVVLMKSKLSDVPAAIRLSMATVRNIHENLFWAFGYNLIGIPLAAGVFIPLLHWQMNPMFGAAAMSMSSFLVVSNALRLNFTDIRKPIKNKHAEEAHQTISMIEEDPNMKTKTMKIEGMMCPHCEAHVKEALEKIDGVESAAASHTAKNAVVKMSKDVDNDLLTKAVVDAGYKVLGIE